MIHSVCVCVWPYTKPLVRWSTIYCPVLGLASLPWTSAIHHYWHIPMVINGCDRLPIWWTIVKAPVYNIIADFLALLHPMPGSSWNLLSLLIKLFPYWVLMSAEAKDSAFFWSSHLFVSLTCDQRVSNICSSKRKRSNYISPEWLIGVKLI